MKPSLQDASESPAKLARSLLARLRNPADKAAEGLADEILLFCYRLRDGYRVRRSTSKLVSGSSFASLHELLYQLESHPDDVFTSVEWRSYLETLLADIADGAIILERSGRN